MSFPASIICLTEESVETLYLLGHPELIVGVSEYVRRPPAARLLPIVSQFIKSDIKKIVDLKPDLVIGFSDLQKDVASSLIGLGLNVYISNQRSLEEILEYIHFLGRIIGAEIKAQQLIQTFQQKIDQIKQQASTFKRRPKIYFEEWDHPRLTCIGWVSELIAICGGENIFSHKAAPMAMDRKVTDEEIVQSNPDIIFGCWCGKPVKLESFARRSEYPTISAIQRGHVWELDPAIFLQPGPALFLDGLDQMFEKITLAADLD